MMVYLALMLKSGLEVVAAMSNWIPHVPIHKTGDIVRFYNKTYIITNTQHFKYSNPSYGVIQIERQYPILLQVESDRIDKEGLKIGYTANLTMAKLLYGDKR